MKRVIVTPAALSGEPLSELKNWLSINSDRDDEVLEGMLRASLEMCETFTGRMPLTQLCDETISAHRTPATLSTRPVQALIEALNITPSAARLTVDPAHYSYVIDSDECLTITLHKSTEYERVMLRFSAGMADNWARLDAGIKQGIIRLAAHYYRERDDGAKTSSPPASVAALWRPWRSVRLT